MNELVSKIGNVEQLELSTAEEFMDTSDEMLAKWINTGHAAIKMAVRRLAIHVAQVGAWLVAAKNRCEHGEWLSWLLNNCPLIAERTARRYMEFYNKVISNRSILTDLNNMTPVQGYRAIGLDEVPHVVVDVDSDLNAMMEYAILDNIRRRQLTDLQLVEYGMKLEKLYEGRKGVRRDTMPDVDKMTTSEGKTRDLVVAKIKEETGKKMSGRKYERLKTIAVKAAPEVKKKLNDGSITQKLALELCKVEDHEEQNRGLQELAEGLGRLYSKARKNVRELQEENRLEWECALFLEEHPHLGKYGDAILKRELRIYGEKLQVVSLKREFTGQERHFPRYSEQEELYELDSNGNIIRSAEDFPVFTEQEWMGINEYSSDVLEEIFPYLSFNDRPFVRESLVTRRIYDPGYGHFLADVDELFPGREGKIYIRRGWGRWKIVRFNDGEGKRITRRFFEQDYLCDTLIEQAFETAHPNLFSNWNYYDLNIHSIQKSEMSWFYFRKETKKREDAIKALEEDLAKLKSIEPLSDAEIEKKAMDILSEHYIDPVGHPDQFREGRQTMKRLPNGKVDEEFMEKLYERFHKKGKNL